MGGGDGAVEDLEDSRFDKPQSTMRQKAVLELLSRGSPNKVIARRLGMSQGAVKFHVRQIMRKFGVTNRTEVAAVCATQPSILGAMADAVQGSRDRFRGGPVPCSFGTSSHDQQVPEMSLEHVERAVQTRASWPGVSASPVSKFDMAACAAPKTAPRSSGLFCCK